MTVTNGLGWVQTASRGHPPRLTLLLQTRMLGLRGAEPHCLDWSQALGAEPCMAQGLRCLKVEASARVGCNKGGSWDLLRQSWVESSTGFSAQRILLLAQA